MAEITVTEKSCSRCKEVLPAASFNLARKTRTGLGSRCRPCDSEYFKEWRSRPGVRDRHVAQMREKYWADPEATRARSRAYRAANREAVRRWKDAEYQRDGAKIRARMRRQYERDKDKWKAAVLAWARANPELVNERNRRYRARKANATIGVVTPALLEAKLAYWGHVCWMCGKDPETWDHVKPLNKGGPHMLANLRPACWSCNSSKSDRWPFSLAPVPVQPQ